MLKIRICSLFFVLVLISSCGGKEENKSITQPIEIGAIRVKKADVPVNMEFVGQTKGSIDAEIRARVEGVITAIHFDEGKEVKEGQLLYSIDPAPFKAKVAAVMGKLSEANTKLIKADSDLKRIKPLVQMRALSERDLDAAIAQRGTAQGSVDAVKAELESANIELSYCEIKSPVTGVIGLSKAKVGEFVGRAPNPVVLNTVSRLNPINVRFAVNEKEYLYFSRLKQKQIEEGKEPEKRKLKLVLADSSVYPETGQVKSVEREIDSKTGTITVEAEFPNPHELVRPGQFAKIRAVAEMMKDAIVLPKRALRELQGQYQVFIVKPDNTVEPRNVKLGANVGENQVIEEGLAVDELVATEGLQRLKAGTLVSAKVQG